MICASEHDWHIGMSGCLLLGVTISTTIDGRIGAGIAFTSQASFEKPFFLGGGA